MDGPKGPSISHFYTSSTLHLWFRCYSEGVKIFALTGGIAAGKTTVAARLSELGAHIISADELVRSVQGPNSPVLARITARFGFGVITDGGELDRAALGRLVFDDEQAKSDLEAIVHPAIAELFDSRVHSIEQSDSDAVIVYDIPLLVETGRASEFDGVILADSPADLRRERLIQYRGMTRNEADSRLQSQASDEARRAIADWVIDTSGTLQQTRERTDEVWQSVVSAIAGGTK
ncbi:MAG: hypothetical protein RIS25_357 [Actinomycetota bacterium]|jgi:dephospho-CoA kinase